MKRGPVNTLISQGQDVMATRVLIGQNPAKCPALLARLVVQFVCKVVWLIILKHSIIRLDAIIRIGGEGGSA
jgi:hypothetical protein